MINYPEQAAIVLNTCADEPLQLIGRVQSYGVLVVLDRESRTVLQMSENATRIFGEDVNFLLKKPFIQLFPTELTQVLTDWLVTSAAYSMLDIEIGDKNYSLRLIPQTELLLIEIEEKQTENLSQLNQMLYHGIALMEKATTLPLLFQAYTDTLLKITAYDRVLLMEFKDNW